MLSSDRPQANKCIDIPKSLSLCYGIQYTTMRLPNLLDHETIDEVIEQSTAWQSLVQLHCNPNTQLFLCSLFAPVCLPKVEKPIKPCRSLCEEVQNNCEDRMRSYGFPWPEMLRCDKFEDNDMCIKPFAAHTTSRVNHACKSCAQASTFENILDNFCRVTTVVRARLRPHNDTHVLVKKAKTFKGTANDRKRLMQDRLMRISDLSDTTCTCPIAKGNFLIMANDTDKGDLVAKLIMHWKHDTAFKNAIRKFRTVNCNTLGREIRESVLRQTYKRTTYN
uniref:Secreted frizzled-related protein 5 n=1 Tax=Panagrellus redivivus TaxID=6233 RepID=A0A7E4V8K6_PANRE